MWGNGDKKWKTIGISNFALGPWGSAACAYSELLVDKRNFYPPHLHVPFCENMTQSTNRKYITYCTVEPRPLLTRTENFVKSGDVRLILYNYWIRCYHKRVWWLWNSPENAVVPCLHGTCTKICSQTVTRKNDRAHVRLLATDHTRAGVSEYYTAA